MREQIIKKACEMASAIAKTGKFGTLSELFELCYENDIFMQEAEDMIVIEDDIFRFEF